MRWFFIFSMIETPPLTLSGPLSTIYRTSFGIALISRMNNDDAKYRNSFLRLIIINRGYFLLSVNHWKGTSAYTQICMVTLAASFYAFIAVVDLV
jgi:hypothetical protein